MRVMELEPVHNPREIIRMLPQGEYATHFQPTYPNEEALQGAIHELQNTTPVTTPENVDTLLRIFRSKVAENQPIGPIILTGNCAEPVELRTPIIDLARRTIAHQLVVAHSELELKNGYTWIERGRGQNTKPRSNELEILQGGRKVTSYMGDAVNSIDPEKRTPDPSRMVAAAVQARDIEDLILRETGVHRPAAHEALLLPYEMSFIRRTTDGKKYLLSCDMPWLGWRTNKPDGVHVQMLSDVENSVGAKLGSNTDENLVKELVANLNPEQIPGKLVFMVRINKDDLSALDRTCKAIATQAPESVIMYDIHGCTTTLDDGTKVRVVDNIIEEIEVLAETCSRYGLRLHGLHLETAIESERLECVDHVGERPIHPGNVDPQLNPDQTQRVINSTKHLWYE